LIPGGSCKRRLKAVSLESSFTKLETLSASAVGDDLSKAFFDKDL